MSTNASIFVTWPGDDPGQVELVRSILEKTREGKIVWSKQGNAITAALPGGLQANFVMSAGPFISPAQSDWDLFTVRDRVENELVRVTRTSTLFAILAGQTPAPVSPLEDAARNLFVAASTISRPALDRAIDAIKKL